MMVLVRGGCLGFHRHVFSPGFVSSHLFGDLQRFQPCSGDQRRERVWASSLGWKA